MQKQHESPQVPLHAVTVRPAAAEGVQGTCLKLLQGRRRGGRRLLRGGRVHVARWTPHGDGLPQQLHLCASNTHRHQ